MVFKENDVYLASIQSDFICNALKYHHIGRVPSSTLLKNRYALLHYIGAAVYFFCDRSPMAFDA
jgi:hypothetical protein